NLEPGRWYWYRFRAGGQVSAIGRTRTAPPNGGGDRLRLAFASCQQYEQGYFTAYRHMLADDLDLIVHVGDYIYESSWGQDHVRLRARLVRPSRADPSSRRPPVPLTPAVRRARPWWRQHRRRLPGTARSAPHHARRRARALARGGARPLACALERHRPADFDGSARSEARSGSAVLDRWMGRLPS